MGNRWYIDCHRSHLLKLPMVEIMKERVIRELVANIRQKTGRVYQINFDKLELAEIQEVIRLIRDIDYENLVRLNRARIMPWRRS
jgi:hypothetical protein